MTRVVVLGGGIAGLTVAFRRPAGGETVVLEASRRAGGAIRTLREDGYVLEGGPNTLRTTAAVDRLLADLGLGSELVIADPNAPRWIVRGGRARAIVPGPRGLFTTALTTRGKLRALGEWRVPRRPATLEDETVHGFFTRRFGAEAARYAAGPIASGVYAGDPESLSVRSAFPSLWEAEARSGGVLRSFLRVRGSYRPRTLNFRSGLERLVEALVAALPSRGARLELGAAAVSIEGPTTSGPRWTIRTSDGRAFTADALVSTLSAPALARLLGDRLPRSADLLSRVPASAVSVVMQAYRPSSADAPRGFGALIPRGEGFQSLGVLYPTSLLPARAPEGVAVTTSFLGGALDPELASASDAELLAAARADVARLHPRLGEPIRSWVVRWPEAIPQLPLGHHRTLAALDEDLAALDAAAGVPGCLTVTSGFRDGIALGARIERGEGVGRGLPAR